MTHDMITKNSTERIIVSSMMNFVMVLLVKMGFNMSFMKKRSLACLVTTDFWSKLLIIHPFFVSFIV